MVMTKYPTPAELTGIANKHNEAIEKAREEVYPCAECGVLRTKAEGGTLFTVCDACWNKGHKADDKAVTEDDDVYDQGGYFGE